MDLIREPKNGDTLDARMTMYPSLLQVVEGERRLGSPTSTSYGYVVSGKARVRAARFEVRADAGSFFCVPDELEIDTTGRVVVIERYGFRGLLMAGRVEQTGRLAYIDGCSDTILVAPPRQGDPVLNHLHFPRGVDQTQHTHPSIRLGIVAGGHGIAYQRGGWEHELAEGCVFLLHEHERHSFRTTESREEMDVIAFHPDSDWGPTDGVHPMLNRTYIGTQPAPRTGT
jgi:quercetin dioxygenase-like cupin family protein